MREAQIQRMNLVVHEYEEAFTQKGNPYLKLMTTAGACTCFDADAIADIKAHVRKPLDVDFKTEGLYRTITRVWGFARDAPVGVPTVSPLAVQKPTGDKSKEIRAAVAFKGAVELCAAGKVDIAQLKEFSLAFIEILKELEK